jgi:hypothetical protein
MIWALILSNSVYLLLRILTGSDVLSEFHIILVGLMLLGGLLLIPLHYGYVIEASVTIVVTSWVAMAYQALVNNGVQDASFLALAVVIMIASLLLGLRFTIVLAVGTILYGWFLVWLELNGYIIYEPRVPVTMMLSYTLIFVLLTALIFCWCII